jgi:hypothetical protein
VPKIRFRPIPTANRETESGFETSPENLPLN